jgi:hypothetical protein
MRKRRVLHTALVFIVSLGGGAAYYAYWKIDSTTRDAYAVWWVADMVIEYMETHNGEWPRGWDDLHEPYETCVRRSGRPWTFDQLRNRVDVDWAADPARLVVATDNGTGPPFQVVWLRSGRSTHWQSREPNRMILDYLHAQKPRR